MCHVRLRRVGVVVPSKVGCMQASCRPTVKLGRGGGKGCIRSILRDAQEHSLCSKSGAIEFLKAKLAGRYSDGGLGGMVKWWLLSVESWLVKGVSSRVGIMAPCITNDCCIELPCIVVRCCSDVLCGLVFPR